MAPGAAGSVALGGSSCCRFCTTPLDDGNINLALADAPAFAAVCAAEPCAVRAEQSCDVVLPCGHPCGGVRGEENCLPCVLGCPPPPAAAAAAAAAAGAAAGAAGAGGGALVAGSRCAAVTLDEDDVCRVCWGDELHQLCRAPSLILRCGHAFHAHCVHRIFELRWEASGPRINFGYTACPLCRAAMEHPSLGAARAEVARLREQLGKKCLMRLRYDNLERCAELTLPSSAFFGKPQAYAMKRYTYFMCFECKEPYYGGEAVCGAAAGEFKPEELICGQCQPLMGGATECEKHGRDYLEYKCRFCCSVRRYAAGDPLTCLTSVCGHPARHVPVLYLTPHFAPRYALRRAGCRVVLLRHDSLLRQVPLAARAHVRLRS